MNSNLDVLSSVSHSPFQIPAEDEDVLAAGVQDHLVARPRTRASVGLGVDGDESPAAARDVVRPEVAQIEVAVPPSEQVYRMEGYRS